MPKLIVLSIQLFIIVFFYTNECLSSEIIYIKTTHFSTKPKPSINATSIDKTTKWFDDKPSAENNDEVEIGFYLPNNYGLAFRKSNLHGIHQGEATKQLCILGSCSYVGAGIVTGNSTTDKISYDIDSLQIIIDKSYKLFDEIIFKPRIGINVLDTMLNYSGTGQNVDENQIVPWIHNGVSCGFTMGASVEPLLKEDGQPYTAAVLIPTINNAEELEIDLERLSKQTFPQFEVDISD